MEEAIGALIQQNGIEKVLAKLDSIKEDNLTAKKKAEIDEVGERFAAHFKYLIWELNGTSVKQLNQFNKKEIKVIADIVAKKAWPRTIIQIGFCVFWGLALFGGGVISVLSGKPDIIIVLAALGWILPAVALGNAESFHYLCFRRTLKKAYGENYFPRNYLGKIAEKEDE